MRNDSAASGARFGELLLEQQLIPEDVVSHALQYQREYGGKLGDILTAQGSVSVLSIYKLLAQHHNMPFIDLMHADTDKSVMSADSIACYLQRGVLPVRKENGTLLVATSNPSDIDVISSMFAGEVLEYYVTSPRDIAWLVQHHFGEMLVYQSSEALLELVPHYSLRQVPSRLRGAQRLLLSCILITLIGMLWNAVLFANIVLALTTVFFFATICLKLLLLVVGKRCRDAVFSVSDVEMPANDRLPVYTLLIPLFQEAQSVTDIINGLQRIDYPRNKLDVKLIAEACDHATIHAIKEASPPEYIDLIIVPPSLPQTKPKACNYAMHFARGEFVGIYDAEDVPDPQQLRKAVAVFMRYPEVTCLQGQLNFYNARENWLTQFFAVEYASLFHFMMPALYHLNIPIPLGGTSNHIRRDVLHKLGAWDAYNVTEDADLGIRLASEGYKTLPLPSLTLEEAPVSTIAWIKQRTRWIKGYLQTWGVMSRNAPIRYQQLGAIGFWGIHFFVGAASLSYVISPVLWCVSLIWGVTEPHMVVLHPVIVIGCMVVMVAGMLAQWFSVLYVRHCVPTKLRISMMFAYPLYFVLHSVAGMRAVYQLFTRPYYWDKTVHAVSNITRPA